MAQATIDELAGLMQKAATAGLTDDEQRQFAHIKRFLEIVDQASADLAAVVGRKITFRAIGVAVGAIIKINSNGQVAAFQQLCEITEKAVQVILTKFPSET